MEKLLFLELVESIDGGGEYAQPMCPDGVRNLLYAN